METSSADAAYNYVVDNYGPPPAAGEQPSGPDNWYTILRMRLSREEERTEEAEWQDAALDALTDVEFAMLGEQSYNEAHCQGEPAASVKAMASLEVPKLGETRELDCAVCLEDFTAGDKLRKMPCSHSFHQRCIFSWLRISCICPVCRFKLPSQAEFESELSDQAVADDRPEDDVNN